MKLIIALILIAVGFITSVYFELMDLVGLIKDAKAPGSITAEMLGAVMLQTLKFSYGVSMILLLLCALILFEKQIKKLYE